MAPKSSMEKTSSPFFLHPRDSTGTVLVTQSLNGDNYHSWCRSMHMALSVKNKLGFVDGSILKPSDLANTTLPSWLYCNNMDLNQWKLIGEGRYKGGLYFLQQSGSSTSDLLQTHSLPVIASNLAKQLFVCSKSSKHALFELWHNRLGHPSVSRMKFLHKLVPNMLDTNSPCLVCPLAKQKKIAISS
ncbi:hypothetical protein F2P56_009326 [Juglans regia]|uniref:Retrotransposon Copia-like N-terminal domain-containing protein n=1 Tax=Juglans regia TaxID=51240 RepID=A0A833XX08_JUGRE|nr:hypothetical protein F2P56_009326 [Juglans regia]